MAAVSWDRDGMHRTSKLLIDAGRAADPFEADAVLSGFVLQVAVGQDVIADTALQNALLTIVNAGMRAFRGGVHVLAATGVDTTTPLDARWAEGGTLFDAVTSFGGELVDRFDPDHPTVVLGAPGDGIVGSTVLHVGINGWSGGIDTEPIERRNAPMPLTGVLAGGLAVSEAFQREMGSPTAGDRNVGLSLWRPDLPWQAPDAVGPSLEYLPMSAWLLGLGHLGQAFAWALGSLPYGDPQDLTIYLMDTDRVVAANHATGLLTTSENIEERKTRVVEGRLVALGHNVAIVDRRFDERTVPSTREPVVALAGFDDPSPRRLLGDRFARVIDAGLGHGVESYLDMLLHTFPSQLDPSESFPESAQVDRSLPPAYEAQVQRLIDEGQAAGDARCGIIDVAGATAAAAFVGTVAAALVVADLLRYLHGGMDLAVLGLDLRGPGPAQVAGNTNAGGYTNIGYVPARTP